MTPANEDCPCDKDCWLESILRAVRSIDRNAEELLDTLNEHLNGDKYDPVWNDNGCENSEDY